MGIFSSVWNHAIGFAGYDPVDVTINGKKASYAGIAYRESVKVQIAAFFLKPFTRMRRDSVYVDDNGRYVVSLGLTLLKNMVWWPEANAPKWQRALQFTGMVIGLITLITPAYVLLSLISSVAINALKLALKVLPQLIVTSIALLRVHIQVHSQSSALGFFARRGLDIADRLLSFTSGIFTAWYFMGSAIISPIDAVRMAYRNNGFWLAALSGFVSFVTLPVVIALASAAAPIVMTNVINLLQANFPGMISALAPIINFLEPVTHFIVSAYNVSQGWIINLLDYLYASIIMPSAFLSNMTMMFNFLVLGNLSILTGLTLTTTAAGFGAVLALASTTIGTAIDRTIEAMSNWFVNNRAKVASVEDVPVRGSHFNDLREMIDPNNDSQERVDQVTALANEHIPANVPYQVTVASELKPDDEEALYPNLG